MQFHAVGAGPTCAARSTDEFSDQIAYFTTGKRPGFHERLLAIGGADHPFGTHRGRRPPQAAPPHGGVRDSPRAPELPHNPVPHGAHSVRHPSPTPLTSR